MCIQCQKRALDPLELELQTIVRLHVGAKNPETVFLLLLPPLRLSLTPPLSSPSCEPLKNLKSSESFLQVTGSAGPNESSLIPSQKSLLNDYSGHWLQ